MSESGHFRERFSNFRDQSGEGPPMSRLFIICDKSYEENDFRSAFSKFGEITDVWIVKDKYTQENKGIAYIKFAKTSDAAKALEDMNGKTLADSDRSLKILVAASRRKGSCKSANEHEKCLRLFVVVSKDSTEDEIRNDFEQWGRVEAVSVVRDKYSGRSKGFAYVRFYKFYDAAIAFENCDVKYKAIFAEPKDSVTAKRGYDEIDGNNCMKDYIERSKSNSTKMDIQEFLRMRNTMEKPSCLNVTCSKAINQDQLWRIFDIIPGLDYCQIIVESNPRTNEAVAVYNNLDSALYAKKKLHGLEYPVGERLIVRLPGVSAPNEICAKYKITKNPLCSVPLPPVQCLAPSGSTLAQRLFIVLSSNLPQPILKMVFSCWKGLIDVYLLPYKNCGYVKYAEKDSAIGAMEILNGAQIYGIKIKVMEAEDPQNEDNRKRKRQC